VGSSGISKFMEVINELNVKNSAIKFASVGSEFRRLFAANTIKTISIYENDGDAVKSFQESMCSRSLFRMTKNLH